MVEILSQLAQLPREISPGMQLVTTVDWWCQELGREPPKSTEWSKVQYQEHSVKFGQLLLATRLGSEVKEVVIFLYPNGMPGLAVRVESCLSKQWRLLDMHESATLVPFTSFRDSIRGTVYARSGRRQVVRRP